MPILTQSGAHCVQGLMQFLVSFLRFHGTWLCTDGIFLITESWSMPKKWTCFAILCGMKAYTMHGLQVLSVSTPTCPFIQMLLFRTQPIIAMPFSWYFCFCLDLGRERHRWGKAAGAGMTLPCSEGSVVEKGSGWLVSLAVWPLQPNVEDPWWSRLAQLSTVIWVAIRLASIFKAKCLCFMLVFLNHFLLKLQIMKLFFISF